MLLAAGEPMSLGSPTPRLMFGEEMRPAGGGVGRRVLSLDEKPAFELSWWCGTCQFVFRHFDGANDTFSIADVRQRLSEWLGGLDGQCPATGLVEVLRPREDESHGGTEEVPREASGGGSGWRSTPDVIRSPE